MGLQGVASQVVQKVKEVKRFTGCLDYVPWVLLINVESVIGVSELTRASPVPSKLQPIHIAAVSLDYQKERSDEGKENKNFR